MGRRLTQTVLAAIAVVAVAVPAALAASAQKAPLKTGPGVSANTIRLGLLSDFSGPFAPQGKVLAAVAKLYWSQVNDPQNRAQRPCGRRVIVEVRDHTYNPATAVALYRQVEPDVLALQQLLGSPMQGAVLPLASQDQVVIGVLGWSSFFSKNPNAVITGATYDITMINGLQFLMNRGMISRGDKIGAVYFAGDYGENALLGIKFFAERNGMSVVEARITPPTTDLSAQVANFRAQGVKAIALAEAQGNTNGLVNAMRAQNFTVPLIGQIPSFYPTLLQGPNADFLKRNFFHVSSFLPFNARTQAAKDVAATFKEAQPDLLPDINVDYAWVNASMFHEALKRACANRDLTRDGFNRAIHSLKDVKTGLTPPISYNVGRPSGLASFIARPADVEGGLQNIAGPITSPLVREYTIP